MTDDERLAVEVMGWIKIDRLHWTTKDGGWVLDGTEWSPSTNIEQAMMCINKMEFWSIEKITGAWFVQVNESPETTSMVTFAEQLPAAICASIIGSLEAV